MKKRFVKIGIGGILLVFFSCVSVLALSEMSISYHFFSQKTAVRVRNYTKKNDIYIPLENTGTVVMPGEFISRIPVVYNEGIDCYIRAKIAISSERESSVPIAMENIIGMNEKWILIGDYFYYKDVLLEDDTVEIFEGICMPMEWNNSMDSENQWEILVKVDAIQAENKIPDFQSEDPWGEKKEKFDILDAREEEVLEEVLKDEKWKGEFIFTIKSEVEELQIGMEESFQNMGSFVPGDEKERKIRICNLDEQERIIYMKTEMSQVNKLFEKMEAVVLWECETMKTILYQGSVSKIHNALERIAFVVPGKTEGILHVFFSLPKTVNNHCIAQEGSLRFIFSDDRIPQENYHTQENLGAWTEEDDFVPPGNVMVQTGDNNKIWNAMIGLSIGICLFLLSIWKGKRGSYEL